MASATFKRCACGRLYTREEWSDLPFLGTMTHEATVTLELRNCPCGSSLAIELEMEPAAPLRQSRTRQSSAGRR